MRFLFAILFTVALVGCATIKPTTTTPPTEQVMLRRCLTWCPSGEVKTVGDIMNECRINCHFKWGKTAGR